MVAITAIICLLAGGATGYYGRQYLRRGATFEPARRAGTGLRGQQNFPGRTGQNGEGFNGGRVAGTIQTLSDGRMTLETPNNSSQIILLNDSTTYQKMTAAALSDIATGTQVTVTGQVNPDGSTTAATIQIGNRP